MSDKPATENKSLPTVDEKKPEENSLTVFNDSRIKKLKSSSIGLNLMLFELSIRESNRIKKLESYVNKIEDEIFDENLIEDLTEDQKIQRYQMALASVDRSANYISGSLSKINFDDIETKLLMISNEVESESTDGTDKDNLELIALDLLQKLSIEKSSKSNLVTPEEKPKKSK